MVKKSSAESTASQCDGLVVVVIGRNEGARLERCLDSLRDLAPRTVYVDSGSSDGSVAMARARGVDVVELDMRVPFTAARARNAGFARLSEHTPDIRYVQFVDGDCEVIPGWLGAATSFLDGHAEVACVCGRLRERYPERSVYNRLCDAEWNRQPGQTDACGGIALMRSEVFVAVGGFDPNLSAGEEPELCSRMLRAGWKIWRLTTDMAWHDADMHRLGQWWTRMRRTGHGCAQSSRIEHHVSKDAYRRRLATTAIWVAVLPVSVIAALVMGNPMPLGALAIYPIQVLRLALRRPPGGRWEHAFFTVLGKFPEFLGQCQFLLRTLRKQRGISFDYKS